MKRLPKIILSIGLFATAAMAQAQVYQWKDPDSRVTRFSNTAPQWYRNINVDGRDPRVQVFYYGALVDDTGLAYDMRMALRSQYHIGRHLPPLHRPGTQHARR